MFKVNINNSNNGNGKKYERKELNYTEVQLKKYVLNRIGEQEYARHELLKKMKNLSKDDNLIDKVLNEMESKGIINDTRRLKSLFGRYNSKYSIKKIKLMLLVKGFKSDCIDEFLVDYVKELEDEMKLVSEINKALLLLKSKYKTYDGENYQKMARFILYKGFSYDDAKKALDLFKSGVDEDDE